MSDASRPLRLAVGRRLQWEEAQQKHVLLYPEGMVELNPSAATILELCDGRDEHAIVDELTRRFPEADLGDDVRSFLSYALDQNWISHAD